MKKLVISALMVCALVPSFQAQKLKGSDTVLPLAQKEAEAFLKKTHKSVSVVGGGSGVGIAALLDGTTDVAMASRKMKFDEKVKMQEAGSTAVEKVIAYDALAVIVNPSNPVSKLTRAQLEGIFTGKIKNWKEVGGPDMKIIPYSRESSSGTYEFFKEHILKNKNYANGIMSMPATGAIVQSVSQTKGAIGYVGLAYLEKDVKALHVSFDGKNFVEPSMATAKNKTYPIIRPLFFYINKKKEAACKPFVDFVLSAQGQDIVEKVGYVPLN
ncbi:PstS family phosphate ABC transporter substrate-binding protein [Parabacteroides sp. FAFU027]|uniref:PstS family phosphate ABC transporter substrate-binding protein n=1 Tax=Parabacteroides sp. FAFU027 TaxID=2922715 RepID=UPI001FAFD369|nr:PstS family phosphate ABC transporter substrate-binding protein [Parabacteroides sp. FAFU027]